MNQKEYASKFLNVVSGNLVLDNNTNIKLHLATPFKKNPKSSFSLIINGLAFFKTKGINGFVLYEFIKQLRDYQIHNQDAINTIANKVATNLIDLFKDEVTDNIKSLVFLIFDEIKRIVNNEKPKGLFSVVYPINYSMHYRRVFGIKVIHNDTFDNLKKVYDDFDLMQKNGIIALEYDKEFINNHKFIDILSLKNSFYQIIKIENYNLTNKNLEAYKKAGLDLIILDIDKLDKNNLPTKALINFIKLVINANIAIQATIKVEYNNIDYLKIIEVIHDLGVKSFDILISDEIENKSSVFKRLYFYLNIYHLEISLGTENIINEKELKKMNLDATYNERYVAWYYYENGNYYLDKELKNNVGNINMRLEECFNSDLAKLARRKKRLRVV